MSKFQSRNLEIILHIFGLIIDKIIPEISVLRYTLLANVSSDLHRRSTAKGSRQPPFTRQVAEILA